MTREHSEHIANMLRHASCKKYENYVISQLYWKLVAKGIELKFVTQQTVFRNDINNHVAYMDGYFPALNIQIEVDEHHHKFQKTADEKREDDIMCVLGAIQLDVQPTVLRIDITKNIDEQVDNCVKFIENTWKKLGCPEWIDVKNTDVVKKQHCIKYNDNMIFNPKNELLNIIGVKTKAGKEYVKYGTQNVSLLHLTEETDLWFPCISNNVATGWLNNYDPKTNEFKAQFVKNFKRNYLWVNSENEFKKGTYKERYIFFKVVDSFNNKGFKYYGKYKCIACDAKNQKETWKRVSTEDMLII